MSDSIRAGIQNMLDGDSGGWQVAHYVTVVGLERVRDGEIETASWLYAEPSQATYVTDGLLMKAAELNSEVSVDEDPD